jgi:hypothetical protein
MSEACPCCWCTEQAGVVAASCTFRIRVSHHKLPGQAEALCQRGMMVNTVRATSLQAERPCVPARIALQSAAVRQMSESKLDICCIHPLSSGAQLQRTSARLLAVPVKFLCGHTACLVSPLALFEAIVVVSDISEHRSRHQRLRPLAYLRYRRD